MRMKMSYVLVNKTGKARKVPPGQAWQWTHHVEDASQLAYLLEKLKKDIRANRLALANLVIERQPFDTLAPGEAVFTYKGPITYDAGIRPHRIFYSHADPA